MQRSKEELNARARENHAAKMARMSPEEREAYRVRHVAASRASRQKNPIVHRERVKASRKKRIEREGLNTVRQHAARLQRERRAANPEAARLTEREWRLRNRERDLISKARDRARRRGLEFDLSPDDIMLPKTCPVFGFPLAYDLTKASFNSPTLDRVKNELGYVKGNVIVVSRKANTMKSDGTVADMEKLLYFYRELERDGHFVS